MHSQKPPKDTLSSDSSSEGPVEDLADSSLPETDLSATVGAFENRFQKRKREKEVADDQEVEATKQRQGLMLEAMMNIRRSLTQVAKIDLGERYYFSMDFDDWQGWPRLTIVLNDRATEHTDYPYFQVLAHDRSNNAMIEFSPGDPQETVRLSLIRDKDFLSLSTTLKKTVRQFLDNIESLILKAESISDVEEQEGNLEQPKAEEAPAEASEGSISGDLFEDDYVGQDFLEKLPTLEEVETLEEDEEIFSEQKKPS